MEINSDFSKQAIVHSDRLEWQPSPMAGVERRMLDRIGDEVARATSIVRYAPKSNFPAHVHGGGEEFLVLDGVFQDEHGDYPVGSYVRNPPQSSHTPGSEEGCTIFVKLWQFDPDDRTEVKLNSNEIEAIADSQRPGVLITPLFKDQQEEVRLEDWLANTEVAIAAPQGAEMLVLEGSFQLEEDEFSPRSWLRLPVSSHILARVGNRGAKVWLKTGHLPYADLFKKT